MPPFITHEEARPASPYPILFAPWKVLRRFSIGPWQVVAEAHEMAARRAYEGHKKSLGRGALCLVRPCGTVEAIHTPSKKGGGA